MKVRKYIVDGVRHVEISDYDPEMRWQTLRTWGNDRSDEEHIACLKLWAEKTLKLREDTKRREAIAEAAPWEDITE